METRQHKKLDQCCICYQKVHKQGKINSCSHTFCHECITNWSKIQNTCPMCKQRFTKISQKTVKKHYKMNQKHKQQQTIIEQRNQGQGVQNYIFTLQQFTEGLLQIIHLDHQLFSSFLLFPQPDSVNLEY